MTYKSSKEFDELVLEAVDEGLSILGDESVKRAFYYHLEKRAKIKRNEIPRKLMGFHEALTNLFFDGSVILEKRISRHLFGRIGMELPIHDGWTIADYVREACVRYAKV